jgi:hypothetical protein
LALAHLEQGDPAEGMRLYAEDFAQEDYSGPVLLKVLDAPSFLWRAELAGHTRDEARWRLLHDFVRRTFPRPGMPFADWHIALIDAVVGEATAAEARERALDELVRDGRYPAGPTVLALARGFAAFERRDFPAAIDAIRSMFDERARICGSRAQIDLVEFTLLKAYLETGRRDEARRLLQDRGTRARGIPVAGVGAVQ